MRDINDSDIEYDLGEINMSVSVKEAHSNGLPKVRDHSDDRDCLAASAWVLPEARVPPDTHLVPLPAASLAG